MTMRTDDGPCIVIWNDAAYDLDDPPDTRFFNATVGWVYANEKDRLVLTSERCNMGHPDENYRQYTSIPRCLVVKILFLGVPDDSAYMARRS